MCCDGLKGLPDSIRATWPLADVQLCVVHLVRSSLRYTSKKHWGQVCREMREIYTAPTVDAAEARFAEFAEQWRDTYPAMIDTWERAWGEFVPFLEFPVELRTIVYTTNAIESLNARFRKAVRHRGHFPNEQAALKVLYLVATERRPNRSNPTGRINAWKTHPERPDHPLRRPHPGRQLTMTITPGYTQNRTVPNDAMCADTVRPDIGAARTVRPMPCTTAAALRRFCASSKRRTAGRTERPRAGGCGRAGCAVSRGDWWTVRGARSVQVAGCWAPCRCGAGGLAVNPGRLPGPAAAPRSHSRASGCGGSQSDPGRSEDGVGRIDRAPGPVARGLEAHAEPEGS